MAHNFIWTSEGIEGIPNQLKCGVEIVDGMIKTFNINPDIEEYLLGEVKANPELDPATLTAENFIARIETKDNYTSLWVTIVAVPDVMPEENAFTRSSNLQILDDGRRMCVEQSVDNALVDPEMLEMFNMRH